MKNTKVLIFVLGTILLGVRTGRAQDVTVGDVPQKAEDLEQVVLSDIKIIENFLKRPQSEDIKVEEFAGQNCTKTISALLEVRNELCAYHILHPAPENQEKIDAIEKVLFSLHEILKNFEMLCDQGMSRQMTKEETNQLLAVIQQANDLLAQVDVVKNSTKWEQFKKIAPYIVSAVTVIGIAVLAYYWGKKALDFVFGDESCKEQLDQVHKEAVDLHGEVHEVGAAVAEVKTDNDGIAAGVKKGQAAVERVQAEVHEMKQDSDEHLKLARALNLIAEDLQKVDMGVQRVQRDVTVVKDEQAKQAKKVGELEADISRVEDGFLTLGQVVYRANSASLGAAKALLEQKKVKSGEKTKSASKDTSEEKVHHKRTEKSKSASKDKSREKCGWFGKKKTEQKEELETRAFPGIYENVQAEQGVDFGAASKAAENGDHTERKMKRAIEKIMSAQEVLHEFGKNIAQQKERVVGGTNVANLPSAAEKPIDTSDFSDGSESGFSALSADDTGASAEKPLATTIVQQSVAAASVAVPGVKIPGAHRVPSVEISLDISGDSSNDATDSSKRTSVQPQVLPKLVRSQTLSALSPRPHHKQKTPTRGAVSSWSSSGK